MGKNNYNFMLKNPYLDPCTVSGHLKIDKRTSDGGNGNHSVSLPIILIKFKVNQMIPSSYISLLMVSIL